MEMRTLPGTELKMSKTDVREKIDLDRIMSSAGSCAISGHIRPDGDCIGSCLGLAMFLRKKYPQVKTDVYLESIRSELRFMPGTETVITTPAVNGYDVFFCLDCADAQRLGENAVLMEKSKLTVCIDHHRTSVPGTDIWFIDPLSASASEIVAVLIGDEWIDRDIAAALYTGIVTDTGVFRYSSTTPSTMRIAAMLMEKGIDHSVICEEAFFMKTYAQQQILGKALLDSVRILDDRAVYTIVTRQQMEYYQVTNADLDGISSQLRMTSGIHVSVFLSELGPEEYKVSLRSDEKVDVSKIAAVFGGGGHLRAAGCTVQGTASEAIEKLSGQILLQLDPKPE